MSLRGIGLELAQHACANRELCTKARAHKPCGEITSLVDRLGFGNSTTPGLISDKRGRGEQRPQGMAVSVVSKVSDPALLPSGSPSPPSPAPASEGESEHRALRTRCNFTDFTDLTDLLLPPFIEIIRLFAPDQPRRGGVPIPRVGRCGVSYAHEIRASRCCDSWNHTEVI